jgi:hypothetical protein
MVSETMVSETMVSETMVSETMESGAMESGAMVSETMVSETMEIGGEKNPVKKLSKYPKVKTIGLFKIEMTKEIYLDNYYSKDFLKKYFS